jgi:predicted small metal-binding protein
MMKVVHCPCGTDVQGETDEDLVAAVKAHIKEEHPDRVGTLTDEQILEGAHEH